MKDKAHHYHGKDVTDKQSEEEIPKSKHRRKWSRERGGRTLEDPGKGKLEHYIRGSWERKLEHLDYVAGRTMEMEWIL